MTKDRRSSRGGENAPPRRRLALSVNASWNVINFRTGLISGLIDAGHEVVVLAPVDAYSSRLPALGVRFEELPLDAKGLSPLGDLRLLWSYYRLFRKLGVDAYLAFTVKPNVYGTIAARLLGIPAINNVAGLGAIYAKNSALTRLVSGLYKLAFRRSSVVFFQNEDDRQLFVAKRIVRPDQAGLLPGSGVDLTRFVPSDKSQEGTGFTFLLTARMLWDKGIGEFVEAGRRLRREFPQARLQLLGFADLPGANAIPRRVIDEWVAEGAVEYLGETDDVRPYLREADCVVLPSRYREGVPRSLLEAAAMAKPLIATNTPGCRDIVEAGVNGLICSAGDTDSLLGAMREMVCKTAAERQQLGDAGRRLVQEKFSEEIVIRRYLAAIDSL